MVINEAKLREIIRNVLMESVYDDVEPLNGTHRGPLITVLIKNDGNVNEAYLLVVNRVTKKKVAFNGKEAQRLIDKIRIDARSHASLNDTLFMDLYDYVNDDWDDGDDNAEI